MALELSKSKEYSTDVTYDALGNRTIPISVWQVDANGNFVPVSPTNPLVTGVGGGVASSQPIVREVFTESSLVSNVLTCTAARNYFAITNLNSSNPLTFVIGTLTIVLELSESFEDYFSPFTTITVTGTGLNFKALTKS